MKWQSIRYSCLKKSMDSGARQTTILAGSQILGMTDTETCIPLNPHPEPMTRFNLVCISIFILHIQEINFRFDWMHLCGQHLICLSIHLIFILLHATRTLFMFYLWYTNI